MHAGIVGAGLLGRLLAWRLLRQGWQVTLFEQTDGLVKESAAYAAGGMLALIAEQETANPLIYDLGKLSLELWQDWLTQLEKKVFFQQKGSLFVADPLDQDLFEHRMQGLKTTCA